MEKTMETAMERAKEAPEKQEVHLSGRWETPLAFGLPDAESLLERLEKQVSGARLESQVQGRSLNPALLCVCFLYFLVVFCRFCFFPLVMDALHCFFQGPDEPEDPVFNFPVFLVCEVAENAGDTYLTARGLRMLRQDVPEKQAGDQIFGTERRVIFECFSRIIPGLVYISGTVNNHR